ncbi:type I-G CRISPR-associated protein, Cas3-extension family [Candidatus Thiosymbion oneisti]|uniref:type I-G CRISPR-associated protein, Cas3-extension family n=1 Tax=Candidatus Thiosymbion oneisti TaxID=589554 RepID=UPI00105D2A2B|nr:hypothetical protein [Candidatus Thiosymbion oneisti]
MSDTFDLNGLDGSNPLAFLASLGVLRGLTLAWPDAPPRLSWRTMHGALRPVLHSATEANTDTLCEALRDQLRATADTPALTFAKDLTVTGGEFRKATVQAQSECSPKDHTDPDYAAAFGCEAVVDSKTGQILDTALRTMSGAGHQHFLAFMGQLLRETSVEQIDAALFRRWTYSDPGPSLRWDPVDDRRYALRWAEPSGDPIRTVRGANALAVLGLPLLPTQPGGAQLLATTGFRQVRRKGTFLTWPIWEYPLSLDVVRSLLALKELQDDRPPREKLAPRGIIEIFRSQRITQGKYRNFTVAQPA